MVLYVMKIKQVLAQLSLGLLVLFGVQAYVGGFVFSHSSVYNATFIVLYLATAWLANRVRRFFLLPNMLPLEILVHSAFLLGLFYLSDRIIGGISLAPLSLPVSQIVTSVFSKQTLGEFGTILLVSFMCGTVYQVINWLYKEK